jgi:hypothetical protein
MKGERTKKRSDLMFFFFHTSLRAVLGVWRISRDDLSATHSQKDSMEKVKGCKKNGVRGQARPGWVRFT